MFKLLIFLSISLFIISCSELKLSSIDCDSDEGCPSGSICEEDKCSATSGFDTCKLDKPCNTYEYCDQVHNICRDNTCETNEECDDLNAECLDVDPDYNICQCKAGFIFDEYNECVEDEFEECNDDVDCLPNEYCDENECISRCANGNGCDELNYEVCIEFFGAQGGFICECELGYIKSPVTKTCVLDIASSCSSDDVCGEHGYCSSIGKCQCEPGYSLDDNKRCMPLPTCVGNVKRCGPDYSQIETCKDSEWTLDNHGDNCNSDDRSICSAVKNSSNIFTFECRDLCETITCEVSEEFKGICKVSDTGDTGYKKNIAECFCSQDSDNDNAAEYMNNGVMCQEASGDCKYYGICGEPDFATCKYISGRAGSYRCICAKGYKRESETDESSKCVKISK